MICFIKDVFKGRLIVCCACWPGIDCCAALHVAGFFQVTKIVLWKSTQNLRTPIAPKRASDFGGAPGPRSAAKLLTKDKAQRIVTNIA